MASVAAGRDLGAWIAREGILTGDGAMGTALQSMGMGPGDSPDLWSLERPDDVVSVHAAFVEAGADLLETNSFGGSPVRLAAFGLQDRCGEINRAAAALARQVAGESALVLGSMGPLGELLDPLGPIGEQQALDGFRRQAAALAEGGADALCVETMIDLREAKLAIQAAAGTDLPVVASLVFESTPRGLFTLMGDAAAGAAAALEESGAAVVGSNCITGSGLACEVVRALGSGGGIPVMIQTNAGLPLPGPEGVTWPTGPEEMARAVPALAEAGASIIGGCCGTGPDHIGQLVSEVRRWRALHRS